MRDRAFTTELVLSVVCTLAAGAIAYVAAGPTAGLVTLVLGVVLSCVFLGVTWHRFRRISELASRVDRVLSGDRDISFSDMSEGELAILSNEIDKALSKLSATNKSVEEERTRLSDALADISHQLKTPLTSLGIELDLIRREADTRELRERAMSGTRLVERVQWLVSSLLKLARIDAGVVRLVRRHVDVAELVEAAYRPLAVSYDLGDVRFVQEIAEGASFEGDFAWTCEALTNVLKNCLEHTPAGGCVRVSSHVDALACRIVVEDSGPGISKEDLPHVFERFYHGRGEGESDVNPAGVGIGLSLARALVSAQGGQITASNAVAANGEVRGARFEISFFKVNV